MAQRPDPTDTAALFVRIPQTQARALDRIAFESRRPKQAIVSELLARGLDRPGAGRRPPIVDTAAPGPLIGWHSFQPTESAQVLTLEGVAELLAVEPEAVAALAGGGDLPGRLIGTEWRFARGAVLAWLARGAVPDAGGG